MSLLRKFLSIIGFIFVSGCGFQPLYGPYSSFPQDDLSQIQVKVIAERSGQIMRNQLMYLLRHQDNSQKKYVLSVTISESRTDQIYDRDATAKRAVIRYDVHYVLRRRGETTPLLEKSFEDSIGFSFGSNAEFASFKSITSEADAKERLLNYLSRKIVEQLAIYFHQHNAFKPTS